MRQRLIEHAEHVAAGLTNQDIANSLGIHVGSYRKRITVARRIVAEVEAA